MSSSAATPAPVAKTPFLSAAAFFLGVAALVFALAIKPLGAAELIGLLACVSAASIFAAIPFAVDHARRLPGNAEPQLGRPPALDADRLAARVAAEIDSRLAAALPALAGQITAELNAAEEKRRAELQTALAAAAAPARPVDADSVSSPVGAQPRLGRGLLGLMHAPGALAKPAAAPSSASGAEDDRAAA